MRTPGTLGLGEKARHLERYISLWVFSLSLLKSESDSNIVFIAVFVLLAPSGALIATPAYY